MRGVYTDGKTLSFFCAGTLSSSVSGDEILIDGMPVGNLFAFAWNGEFGGTFFRSSLGSQPSIHLL